MFDLDSNQTLLLSCLIVLIGVGTYLTYFRQQSTLESLEQEIEAKQNEQEEIQTLQSDLEEATSQLTSARRTWHARYKIVPETVTSPDVVGYLTELTQTGFKTFNVTSEESGLRDGYSVRTFSAEGEAYFTNLYRFVWTIENNRPFYRIHNLQLDYLEERTQNEETGRMRMDVLVSFQMDVEAIYGVVEGLDEGAQPSDEREIEGLPVAQTTPSPPLPSSVLPNPAPDANPFYPLVFDEIPPNEHGRLNVEAAQLISIIQGEAIFQTDSGLERVGEGDQVYLGRIVEVDASEGRVVARLNKGGVVDRIELTLDSESPLQRIPDGDESGGEEEQ